MTAAETVLALGVAQGLAAVVAATEDWGPLGLGAAVQWLRVAASSGQRTG